VPLTFWAPSVSDAKLMPPRERMGTLSRRRWRSVAWAWNEALRGASVGVENAQGVAVEAKPWHWSKTCIFAGVIVLFAAVMLQAAASSHDRATRGVTETADLLSEWLTDDDRASMGARNTRNREAAQSAAIAALLWVTGVGLIAVGAGAKLMGVDQRRCPYCRTRVRRDASVCRQCGYYIGEGPPTGVRQLMVGLGMRELAQAGA
jgi:hypothetical protein